MQYDPGAPTHASATPGARGWATYFAPGDEIALPYKLRYEEQERRKRRAEKLEDENADALRQWRERLPKGPEADALMQGAFQDRHQNYYNQLQSLISDDIGRNAFFISRGRGSVNPRTGKVSFSMTPEESKRAQEISALEAKMASNVSLARRTKEIGDMTRKAQLQGKSVIRHPVESMVEALAKAKATSPNDDVDLERIVTDNSKVASLYLRADELRRNFINAAKAMQFRKGEATRIGFDPRSQAPIYEYTYSEKNIKDLADVLRSTLQANDPDVLLASFPDFVNKEGTDLDYERLAETWAVGELSKKQISEGKTPRSGGKRGDKEQASRVLRAVRSVDGDGRPIDIVETSGVLPEDEGVKMLNVDGLNFYSGANKIKRMADENGNVQFLSSGNYTYLPSRVENPSTEETGMVSGTEADDVFVRPRIVRDPRGTFQREGAKGYQKAVKGFVFDIDSIRNWLQSAGLPYKDGEFVVRTDDKGRAIVAFEGINLKGESRPIPTDLLQQTYRVLWGEFTPFDSPGAAEIESKYRGEAVPGVKATAAPRKPSGNTDPKRAFADDSRGANN